MEIIDDENFLLANHEAYFVIRGTLVSIQLPPTAK